MRIFRHGPVRGVQGEKPEKQRKTPDTRTTPDLPALPEGSDEETETGRRKPYLAIPKGNAVEAQMTRILTVLCSGADADIDDAVWLAGDLVEQKILVKFEDGETCRPVVVEGEDSIEILCPTENFEQARAAFKRNGFGFVGDE